MDTYNECAYDYLICDIYKDIKSILFIIEFLNSKKFLLYSIQYNLIIKIHINYINIMSNILCPIEHEIIVYE